jgi:hypothetical protein
MRRRNNLVSPMNYGLRLSFNLHSPIKGRAAWYIMIFMAIFLCVILTASLFGLLIPYLKQSGSENWIPINYCVIKQISRKGSSGRYVFEYEYLGEKKTSSNYSFYSNVSSKIYKVGSCGVGAINPSDPTDFVADKDASPPPYLYLIAIFSIIVSAYSCEYYRRRIR